MPTISWFVGNEPIGNGSNLIITNVNKRNATIYICEASNSAGLTRATARLVVFGKWQKEPDVHYQCCSVLCVLLISTVIAHM